ncbi:DUF2179 domain-containing protein [Bacillus spongiae]|uniref:UPF0316 protein WAK64_07275 n=1 Tax=Bacillus spongiae TaxID=2683610 RepID=A0ABU8HBZ7_9BACI
MLTVPLIFLLQIIYVPILTLRTIFLVKNRTKTAAGMGLLEAIIYIVSLGIVFNDLTNIFNIAAYVIGFSVGLLLGGTIEKKLAIGYVTYQVSLLEKNMELVHVLRTSGFGVTVFEGEGIDSNTRYRLDIISQRSREGELLDIINHNAPKAFLTSYEIRSFKGGFMTSSMKKRFKVFKKNKIKTANENESI